MRPRDGSDAGTALLARRHLRAGWWSLLLFLTVGAALETLHGFKVPAYVAADNELRRLLWTLAHAHGTLLAIVNLAFALTLPHVPDWTGVARTFASRSLFGATVLLPAGFFFGGAFLLEGGGDPGPIVLLTPVGALLLFIAVMLVAGGSRGAFGASRRGSEPGR
jgi:hypothetical protein